MAEMEGNFPKCQKCDQGVLIPLSDYGRDGAPITYKAWVCTDPECGFNLRPGRAAASESPGPLRLLCDPPIVGA